MTLTYVTMSKTAQHF